MDKTTSTYRIIDLVDSIHGQRLVLPSFQRGYIWTREQAQELVSALFKGYPVGTLLFWRTADPVPRRNPSGALQTSTHLDVILDGEQILTCLFMLTTGDIPPYYAPQDIAADPRDLCYNLDTGDLQYYQPSMDETLLWWRLPNCFSDPDIWPKILEAAQRQEGDDRNERDFARRFYENLQRLREVLHIALPVVIVAASFDEALDIFQRLSVKPGEESGERRLDIPEILRRGESARVEFKSSLQWDVKEARENRELRFEVLRTISAFLNTAGGILLIGVSDDGRVLGLAQDLRILKDSRDRFEQTVMNLVSQRIGAKFSTLIHSKFLVVDGQTVCAVEVNRAAEPAFVKNEESKKQFYVRGGNTTRLLDIEETVDYVRTRFRSQ